MKLTLSAAMRARDVSRLRPEHLADAEAAQAEAAEAGAVEDEAVQAGAVQAGAVQADVAGTEAPQARPAGGTPARNVRRFKLR